MPRRIPNSWRLWRPRILSLALAPLMLAALPTDSLPTAATEAAPTAVPAYRQANKVAVLTIRGRHAIDGVTLRSLERRVETAVRAGAEAIVLDIDTPGGEVPATLNICHLIRTDAPANTIAWINPKAYSAGTIIALAAREIVVHPNASFGDAAPIQAPLGMLVQMAPAERAKIEAPLLEDVIHSARRNHYDEKLVQAFVSVGIELWLVEHVETGDKIFVDRHEYRTIFGSDPPQQITGVSPVPPAESARREVTPWIDRTIPLRPQRAVEDEVDSEVKLFHQLPSTRLELTEADRGKYRLIKQVISADRLLVVSAAEAMYYGLAAEVIANDAELMAYFGAQELVRYDEVWSEGLARFLMSWPVRLVLIVVFLVALFLELAAPGMGVFGITAIVALLLLLGAPALMGMAQWWGIALVVIGLGLIAVELFVLPGVGVAGVAGLLALMIGLIGAFVTGDVTSPEGQDQLWRSVGTTVSALFGAGVLIWILSKWFRTIPIIERLILTTEIGPSGAGETAAAPTLLESMGVAAPRSLAAGDLGTAHTDLRPAGRGDFNGRILDVQSVGGWIEKGTPIRIVSVGRYVIDVEEANA